MLFKNKTILAVDDDSEILTLYKRLFDREKIKVRLAVDATDALTKSGDADLLITDLDMPGPSGIDLVQMLRTRKSLPAILVTGKNIIPEEYLTQVDVIFPKPFDIKSLVTFSKFLLLESLF